MPKLAANTDNIYVLLLIGMGGMFLLVSALVVFYMRNQQRMRKQYEERQAAELQHQKELTYAVIQSQEEERRRIGRDLHDDVGSGLSNLKLQTVRFPEGDPLREFRAQIDMILNKVRNISHLLLPGELEVFGLEEAVEELCHVIHQGGTLDVRLINEASETIQQLAYDRALPVYRVLQELFTNTIRHAGAGSVRLSFLVEGECLICLYMDDGVGFKPGKGGMGMRNIESRLGMIGATYELLSSQEKGFSIRISIPA
jgi:signal transduction histidine kinase